MILTVVERADSDADMRLRDLRRGVDSHFHSSRVMSKRESASFFDPKTFVWYENNEDNSDTSAVEAYEQAAFDASSSRVAR